MLEVVRLLEQYRISVWLDGGWGVDALLGTQLRRDDVDAVMQLLAERGFVLVQGGAPKSFVPEDARGRSIDVHPVRVDGEGNGIYRMDNRPGFAAPSGNRRYIATRIR